MQGIPGVYQKNGGYYFHVSYQRRQIHRRGGSLAEAVIGRQKAMDRIANGLPPFDLPASPEGRSVASKPATVANVCGEYLEARSERRIIDRYRLCDRHLCGFFGGLLAVDLSEATLRKYVKARQETKVTNATIAIEFRFLKAAFRYAKRKGRISSHCFDVIDKEDFRSILPKQQPRHVYQRTSREDMAATFERIIEAHPERFRAPLRLARLLGTRKGEHFGLLWKEVRGDRIELTDRAKGGKARTMFLSPEAEALIPNRPMGASDDSLVFPGPKGASLYNSAQEAWRQACKKAKAEGFQIHDLRREFISAAFDTGNNPVDIMSHVGHGQLATTQIYAKKSEEGSRRLVAEVAR